MFRLLLIIALWLTPIVDASAQSSDPFWDIVQPNRQRKKRKKIQAERRSEVTKADLRNHSLGIGLNVPEFFPLQYEYRFSEHAAWFFYAIPPLPFDIRVELPRDTISKKTVVVDQPALNIELKASYGPQFGTAFRWSPFGNGFYNRIGIGVRRLRISGEVQSPIIILVDKVEITTRTEFGIRVNAVTESLLGRYELGWRFDVGESGYIDWTIIGVAVPAGARNSADVVTFVDAPGDNDDIDGALETLKNEKESELREKALKEMEPAGLKVLPIVGLTAGFRF